MANLKAEFSKNPFKIAGMVLFCFGAIILFFHRLPHREYVTAHADKPRPKAAAEAPAPKPAAPPVSTAALPPPPRAPGNRPAVDPPCLQGTGTAARMVCALVPL